MNIEGLAKATVPVVLGVLIAGLIMFHLGSTNSVLAAAQGGFDGVGPQ